MHKLRNWLTPIVLSAAVGAAALASAAGLGGGSAGAVLGQPLDFAVQVRLDAGESLGPECVAAEVTMGERKLPPGQVKATVEIQGLQSGQLTRIRVSTSQAVDEPVVGISLSAGCSARIMRRYVVLADPPINNPPVVSMPPAAADAAALPVAEAAPPAAPPATLLAQPVQAMPAPSAGAPQPTNTARRRVAAGSASAAPGAAQRPQRQRAAAAKITKRVGTKAARTASAATTAAAAAPAAPRLKLDLVAPPPSSTAAAVEEAIEAVAQAASATRAAAAAASNNADRLATMERMVEQLRSDAKVSRDLAAEWREKLVESDQSGRWMLPLLVMTLILAALAAWLAWRLSVAQRERQQEWQHAAVPPLPPPFTLATPSRQPTAPVPFETSLGRGAQPVKPAARARSAPAWPPPVSVEPPARDSENTIAPTAQLAPQPSLADDAQRTLQTEVLPANVHIDEGAARDVSIEELIDLEQQAEFFVVLGQDDSAVDLLNEHLRSSGGGSPLPYLKLLEIHHRRGSRKAYDSLRERFNHRFNAYAPEWGADLLAGRALADYSGVIPRLQQVWARPLDAMAELEALLFRKSRGELFELPAYREVLFLYALARDLLDREAADSGAVDLLLPMADGGVFSTTSPAPLVLSERTVGHAVEPDGPDEYPTLPLDFDLSAAERPISIFHTLDEPATRPPERR